MQCIGQVIVGMRLKNPLNYFYELLLLKKAFCQKEIIKQIVAYSTYIYLSGAGDSDWVPPEDYLRALEISIDSKFTVNCLVETSKKLR